MLPAFAPTADVAGRVIDGEALLVLPAKGDAIVLNEVGSRIWELIVESLSTSQIVTLTTDEFSVDRATAEHDYAVFCADLVRRGFLTPCPPALSPQEQPSD